MPQSLVKILVHIVFSTKDRIALIDKPIENQLHAYMATIFDDVDSPAVIIGGRPDHVHALILLSRTTALSDVIKKVKGESSKWIKTKGVSYRRFFWQSGYGAFSVSESQLEIVKKYIREQKVHDEGTTFKNELRGLFRKHGIVYDERYVWD